MDAVRTATTSDSVSRTANAPSIGVPLSFIVFGLVCLIGSVSLIVVHPAILSSYHYNQYVVAATHLALLGWVGSVVFGALYQLVPVALETRLFSERLAFAQLLFHSAGLLGMVWSFWHWNLKHVGHWGSVFAVGVGLLLFNMTRTVIGSRKWNPISFGIGSAGAWLMLTVLAGLAIAAAKCSYESLEARTPGSALAITLRGLEATGQYVARFDAIAAMHTHAHLGALGGFVLLLITISFKLLPMFTLSEMRSPRRAWWVIGLLNVGLLGEMVTLSTRSPWKLLFTGMILCALLFYGLELRAILHARKRRELDLPLKMFLWSLAVLFPIAALAGILSSPNLPLTVFSGQLENLYGFLAVFGLLSGAILAMLFKILPFLVWYGTYSPYIGQARVPNLADMYCSRMVGLSGALYLAALIVASAGILVSDATLVRCGAGVMTAAVALHIINYSLILSHRLYPRLQPAAANAA